MMRGPGSCLSTQNQERGSGDVHVASCPPGLLREGGTAAAPEPRCGLKLLECR